MRVDLQRAIEMSTFFYRSLAAVFDHSRPKNRLPLIVRSLQFKPRVVSVDRATGEKVPNFFCSNHHIHAHRVTTAQRRLRFIQWRRDGRDFTLGRRINNLRSRCVLAYKRVKEIPLCLVPAAAISTL